MDYGPREACGLRTCSTPRWLRMSLPPSPEKKMLTRISRASICPGESGCGMMHRAKVGDIYGDRYTTPANGGHERCMAPCGMNTTKERSLCPPSRKPLPSPRTRAKDTPSSRTTSTGTMYRQIGTCGLRATDRRWSKTSFSSRIDSRRSCSETGRRNSRPGPAYEPSLPAEAEVPARARARADKGRPAWLTQDPC